MSQLATRPHVTRDYQRQYERRTHSAFVTSWLHASYEEQRDNTIGKSNLFHHYLRVCHAHGFAPRTAPVFGKYVRKAFPNVRSIRSGPPGSVVNYYQHLMPRSTNDRTAILSSWRTVPGASTTSLIPASTSTSTLPSRTAFEMAEATVNALIPTGGAEDVIHESSTFKHKEWISVFALVADPGLFGEEDGYPRRRRKQAEWDIDPDEAGGKHYHDVDEAEDSDASDKEP